MLMFISVGSFMTFSFVNIALEGACGAFLCGYASDFCHAHAPNSNTFRGRILALVNKALWHCCLEKCITVIARLRSQSRSLRDSLGSQRTSQKIDLNACQMKCPLQLIWYTFHPKTVFRIHSTLKPVHM